MNLMKKDQISLLKERYDKLKTDLSNPHSFPYINTLLNLPTFIKENEALYSKITKEIRQLKKHTNTKRQYKLKTSPFYLQSSVSSTSNRGEDTFSDISSKNQILRANIAHLREENEKKRLSQVPKIKEKQQQLKQKREEVQRLMELNRQMKRAVENEELLQLYQQKCRECESLRIINNTLSQQLKTVINEINKITGSEQNPNMFLLSLGIR